MAIDGPGSGSGSNGGYPVGPNRPMGPPAQQSGTSGNASTSATGSPTGPQPFMPQTQSGNTGATSNDIDNAVLLPTGPGWYSAGKGGRQNEVFTTTLAKAYYWRMTPAQRGEVNKFFNTYGKPNGFRSPRSMWGAFVDSSVNTGYTPFELMNQLAARAAAGAQPPVSTPTGGGSSSAGGGTQAFTNRTVTLTDRSTAHALIDQALQQYLGRDATAKERTAFFEILTTRQQGNPQIDSGISGPSGNNVVRSGGTNPEETAIEFAQSRKGYSEYQASTTYLDAFIDAIKNPTAVI